MISMVLVIFSIDIVLFDFSMSHEFALAMIAVERLPDSLHTLESDRKVRGWVLLPVPLLRKCRRGTRRKGGFIAENDAGAWSEEGRAGISFWCVLPPSPLRHLSHGLHLLYY